MNHSENSNHYGLLIDIIFPLKHISRITACSDASCMLEVQSKKKKKKEGAFSAIITPNVGDL